MGLSALIWRFASPYDAYVSHVAQLSHAIGRIRYLSDVALRYEAGLQGSVRLVPGDADAQQRASRFRERLGTAAAAMSDEQFEEFIGMLGGGERAEVERDRASVVDRLSSTTRGLEEYFALAGHQLTTLEKRGYNPKRPDVARQLRENRLPAMSLPEIRHELHELGSRVGKAPAR
jgi:hypothetical protein